MSFDGRTGTFGIPRWEGRESLESILDAMGGLA
jgi:hypothetical protein